MEMVGRWPKAVFYDSHTTLFDWGWCWRTAVTRLLERYGVATNAEAFLGTWQRLFSGEQRKSAFASYRPLSELVAEALELACQVHGLPGKREDARVFFELQEQVRPFPEVEQELQRQQAMGLKVLIFSNVERRYLERYVSHFGRFQPDLLASSEEAGVHKPNPRAYRWVLGRVGLEPREVLYCASPGFDVAGAMSVGMLAVWLRRPEADHTREGRLGPEPAADFESDSLQELTELLRRLRGGQSDGLGEKRKGGYTWRAGGGFGGGG